jgi:hypothetical protein
MPEFKIRIEVFVCPPFMYGKVIFPVGNMESVEGRPILDTNDPDLKFFDCVGRVDKVREIVESVWGQAISDEFILKIVSDAFAGKSVKIYNYDPAFVQDAMKNFLFREATRFFAQYYPKVIRGRIGLNLYQKSFEYSFTYAE